MRPPNSPMGLIPAGAGRTEEGDDDYHDGPAHPRWRGEDRVGNLGGGWYYGSSPLARGGHAQEKGGAE